ncbi:hypothetical protein [Thiolapillus sp.]
MKVRKHGELDGNVEESETPVVLRRKDLAGSAEEILRLLCEEVVFWNDYVEHCRIEGKPTELAVAVEALAQSEMKLQSFLGSNSLSAEKWH